MHPVIHLLFKLITTEWLWLLIHEVSRLHPTTYHRRLDSSGRAISSSQRPLPDNTHNRQRCMPPVGFEPTTPAGERHADLRPRPLGHWDRRSVLKITICIKKIINDLVETLWTLGSTEHRPPLFTIKYKVVQIWPGLICVYVCTNQSRSYLNHLVYLHDALFDN